MSACSPAACIAGGLHVQPDIAITGANGEIQDLQPVTRLNVSHGGKAFPCSGTNQAFVRGEQGDVTITTRPEFCCVRRAYVRCRCGGRCAGPGMLLQEAVWGWGWVFPHPPFCICLPGGPCHRSSSRLLRRTASSSCTAGHDQEKTCEQHSEQSQEQGPLPALLLEEPTGVSKKFREDSHTDSHSVLQRPVLPE